VCVYVCVSVCEREFSTVFPVDDGAGVRVCVCVCMRVCVYVCACVCVRERESDVRFQTDLFKLNVCVCVYV